MIFNKDVRRVINEAFKHLSSVFVQIVAVHRRYHGLMTNQKLVCKDGLDLVLIY